MRPVPGIGLTVAVSVVLGLSGVTSGEISAQEPSDGGAGKDAAKVAVEFIPEMERMPEDSWAVAREPEKLAADLKNALAAWKLCIPDVEKQLTAAAVRQLSRWAQKQMADYKTVPSIRDVTFQPERLNEAAKQIRFESTVDKLPSHSPIVFRQLKIFLLYNQGTAKLERVIVTIRGWAEE